MSNTEVCFNPSEHLMKIGKRDDAKDYLAVQWRLVWVNDVVDRAVAAGQDVKLDIDTEEIDCDLDKEFSAEVFAWNSEKRRSEKVVKVAKGYAKYKATVTLQIGNMIKRASATKSERAVDFPDFIEKANTGAVGRALAMIGFGTQFTGPEFDEGTERIVDAPVDRSGQDEQPVPQQQTPRQQSAAPTPANNTTPARITEQQIASIRKLSEHLNRPEPEGLTEKSYLVAKRLIEQMTGEYRNLHAPTSTVNAPEPATLLKRCTQLGINVDQLVLKVLKANIPDGNWTPEECAKLQRALNIIEENRAKKAS